MRVGIRIGSGSGAEHDRAANFDKPYLSIEILHILSVEEPAPQRLKFRMADDTFEHPLRKTSPAIFRKYKNISKVRDNIEIGDGAAKSDKFTFGIFKLTVQSEDQCRMLPRVAD